MSSLDHRLLHAANSIVDKGFASDRYKAASRTAERPVYEVRDHSSGCRGAMILDDNGDPWLVYAGYHDWSDAKVAAALKKSRSRYWMPNEKDFAIREAEDAWLASKRLAADTLDALIIGIHNALLSPNETVECGITDHNGSEQRLEVQVISGKGQPLNLDESGDQEAYITVSILSGPNDYESRQTLQRAISYLKPKSLEYNVIQSDGSLYMEVTVSEAIIAQLFASVVLSSSEQKPSRLSFTPYEAQPCLHYIRKESLIPSMVYGKAALSLCGVWFIPSQDESSGKPICKDCEKIEPVFNGLHQVKLE
ncbi:DUF3039 domain-containing protein [Bifidobacterium bohemicum]|uniref:DUF3039 domain-containing protein n=1 Tax=Bifidobacterium bohemicum TaxID=638617 RepID=UPI001377080F|nr:DUF3039 domain-containing protein [Bifidobacterium bohemicum]